MEPELNLDQKWVLGEVLRILDLSYGSLCYDPEWTENAKSDRVLARLFYLVFKKAKKIDNTIDIHPVKNIKAFLYYYKQRIRETTRVFTAIETLILGLTEAEERFQSNNRDFLSLFRDVDHIKEILENLIKTKQATRLFQRITIASIVVPSLIALLSTINGTFLPIVLSPPWITLTVFLSVAIALIAIEFIYLPWRKRNIIKKIKNKLNGEELESFRRRLTLMQFIRSALFSYLDRTPSKGIVIGGIFHEPEEDRDKMQNEMEYVAEIEEVDMIENKASYIIDLQNEPFVFCSLPSWRPLSPLGEHMSDSLECDVPSQGNYRPHAGEYKQQETQYFLGSHQSTLASLSLSSLPSIKSNSHDKTRDTNDEQNEHQYLLEEEGPIFGH